MNSNTDFKYMRDILKDGKYELLSVYEHGLSDLSRFNESFKRLSDKFSESGLAYGAAQFKELSEIASSSRFDAEWKPDRMVLLIAETRNYIGICEDRLNFYEILDDMNGEINADIKA